jgi:molybdate transport system substrate-binding protein
MRVLCTNGLKTVMLDLAPDFERTIGTKVVITWGSANGLLKELETGAGGDLAILTAEAIDGLIKEGKVVAGSRVDLARSGIGLAVRKGAPKPDIGSSDALKRALIAAKSVAHSRTGMSGIYFPTVLARLGIADEMRSKIVTPDRWGRWWRAVRPRSACSRSASSSRSPASRSSAPCRRRCRRSRRFRRAC